jgi:hypothetical protein
MLKAPVENSRLFIISGTWFRKIAPYEGPFAKVEGPEQA